MVKGEPNYMPDPDHKLEENNGNIVLCLTD